MSEGKFRRKVGLLDAFMIGLGAIIGAGIFVVTGIAAGLAGAAVIFSVLIASVIASLTAYTISDLGRHIPKEGGIYQFAYEMLSPKLGFITGWMWILSYIFVGAAVSTSFSSYLFALLRFQASELHVKAVSAALCLMFTAVNYFGVHYSARVNNILVALKVAVLLLFAFFGAFFIRFKNLSFQNVDLLSVFQGAALLFFAYVGFARITTLGEEIKSAEKTIPSAVFLSLTVSTALYFCVSFVAVGCVGSSVLAGSESPLSTAISVANSQTLTVVVSVGALFATASVLLTAILGVSRVTYAMARNTQLPNFIGKLHPKHGTPYLSVLITGLLMTLAAASTKLANMVAISSFASLFYYSVANIAGLKLNQANAGASKLIPVLGAVSCISLTVFLSPESLIVGVAGLASGVLVYLALIKRLENAKKLKQAASRAVS